MSSIVATNALAVTGLTPGAVASRARLVTMRRSVIVPSSALLAS